MLSKDGGPVFPDSKFRGITVRELVALVVLNQLLATGAQSLTTEGAVDRAYLFADCFIRKGAENEPGSE